VSSGLGIVRSATAGSCTIIPKRVLFVGTYNNIIYVPSSHGNNFLFSTFFSHAESSFGIIEWNVCTVYHSDNGPVDFERRMGSLRRRSGYRELMPGMWPVSEREMV